MNFCEKCNISLLADKEKCPLCGARVHKASEEYYDAYPYIPSVYRTYSALFRMLLFLSVILCVLSIILNIVLPIDYKWSFFIVGAILWGWVSLIILINKRGNLHKSLLWGVVILCTLSVFWDYFTSWRGWSTNFVIPLTFLLALIIMPITAKVLKSSRGDYFIYLLLNCIFCFILIVLMLVNIITIKLPSLLCVGASIISLSYLFIFCSQDLFEELKRRLHL